MSAAQEKRFTYEDMLSWDEQTRMELVHGVPVMMAGASQEHQEISGEIFAQLHSYLRGKNCRVYYAPFDVRLFETAEDKPENVDTVVEPDILVVCDPQKLDRAGCKGAPDMVVEILSPSSLAHDRIVKYNLYQEAGVREYWIVSPEEKSVTVFLLNEKGFFEPHAVYRKNESAKVNVLEGCTIDLKDVFPS